MYHSNFHTEIIVVDIFNQLKHITSKALVSQWVHPSILQHSDPGIQATWAYYMKSPASCYLYWLCSLSALIEVG